MSRNQPRHDLPGPHKDVWGTPEPRPSKANQKRLLALLHRRFPGNPGGDAEPGPVPGPVSPDAPAPASGGAAAPLD